MRRLARALAALAASGLVLVLAGCTAPSVQTPAPTTPATRTKLVVFAASSLNKAFEQVGVEYRKTHTTTDLTFSFLGSQDLLSQLEGGAAADVFAAADQKTMDAATERQLVVGTPAIFATNTLVLITPAGNPAGITGLDASLDGRKLVVCAPAVPCGAATRTLSAQLGVTLAPVSEEQKVTDVRGKVEAGEADAGIVYATDAKQAGEKVTTIGIQGAEGVVNRYPIAVTAAARQPAEARAFADFVVSDAGLALLAAYGFGRP